MHDRVIPFERISNGILKFFKDSIVIFKKYNKLHNAMVVYYHYHFFPSVTKKINKKINK